MEKVVAYAAGQKIAGTAIGGKATLAAAALGGFFIAAMSLAMAPAKSGREMFVAFMSFAAFGICGSYGIVYGLGVDLPPGIPGWVMIFGLASLCGAPSWVLTRAWFAYLEKNKDKSFMWWLRWLKKLTGK